MPFADEPALEPLNQPCQAKRPSVFLAFFVPSSWRALVELAGDGTLLPFSTKHIL